MLSAFIAIGIVVALLVSGYSVLGVFVGAMSDNPGAGQDTAAQDIWTAAAGLVILIALVIWAVFRWMGGG